MSGVKVTNERPPRRLRAVESVAPSVDDENMDWEPTVGGGGGELDQWKQPVVAATTGNITIATGLNVGDAIDGVTLADGDRVLVKGQTASEENGIYLAGTTPERAPDMDEDDEVLGAVVYVIAGTTNAGTAWACDLTAAPVVDTDPITFAAFGSAGAGSALTIKDEGTPLATAATSIDFVGAGVVASGTGAAKTVTIPGASIAAHTYELANEGGDPLVKVHGSTGSTETIDPTDGNVHTLTLNANCAFTLNAPAGTSATLELWITQDGTGGWAITWPGSVTVVGTLSTTLNTTSIVVLTTVDTGTSWVAVVVGSGASFATPAIVLGTAAAPGAATTAIRSDATIAAFDATVPVTQAFSDAAATGSAAFAARRDHVHGMPAAPTSGSGSADHMHVVSETHLSNGSTVTWTLDQFYEPGSVIAWNITTLARLTVTEVLPDQATVSAAGTTGDSIVFDYAATVG